jgi:DNA polymerase-1
LEKKEKPKSMRDVELEEIKEYAAEDADITFQLKQLSVNWKKPRQRNF